MAANPKLDPGDLTKEELLAIVEGVREVLWPLSNPDHVWTPETVESVASVLDQYHLRP
jgi:hypothetical protein